MQRCALRTSRVTPDMPAGQESYPGCAFLAAAGAHRSGDGCRGRLLTRLLHLTEQLTRLSGSRLFCEKFGPAYVRVAFGRKLRRGEVQGAPSLVHDTRLTMTIPLPPPRVLWPKMLKACSRADLELLRCEVLIQMANEDFRSRELASEERVEFLHRIKVEMSRRKRAAATSQIPPASSQAAC